MYNISITKPFTFASREEISYKKFATDTYNKIYDDIKKALKRSGDESILAVSGENHKELFLDQIFNKAMPNSFANPSYAAITTHISIIQAATNLVGKEDVLLSVELTKTKFDSLKENFTAGRKNDSDYYCRSMNDAVYFALENGIKISADDHLEHLKFNDPKRYKREIDVLRNHASADDAPKIISHLCGAFHIGTLHGFSLRNLKTNGHIEKPKHAFDPFKDIYRKTLYYNTLQETPTIKMAVLYDKGIKYAMRPSSATQFHPPGALSNKEKSRIPLYIEEAAEERLLIEVARNTQDRDVYNKHVIDG